uniref:Integrase n=1 Tax=Meloidogyne incognita TaxID=6306 RepID=A0A914NJN1_MELIC
MPTLAPGLHTEWQADLSVFNRISKQNQGYKYLLVCIDTLSRQIFVEPVKSKHSDNMINAFKKLFSRTKVVPWKLLTDQGLEFTAKQVQKYFKSLDMEHFSMLTSPLWHAGMAERANRSIKERLYSIGMRPTDVNFKNAEKLRQLLKNRAIETHASSSQWRRKKFLVGDKVRIEKYKHIFQKGYLPNFTNEIFIIDKVRLVPYQPPTYKIKDSNGEQIRGWFYSNDLILVKENSKKDENLYDINKVLKKRKRDGEEYVFVSWKGYGPEHNSWIPANSITWR